MPSLRFVICDIWGTPLSVMYQRTQPRVTIPMGSPRSASVVLSAYDDAAFYVTDGLDRILKVFYPGMADPLFTGILTEPDWDGANKTVTLNAIDGWLRLQKAFLHDYLDFSVTGERIALVMGDLIGRAANRPYPIGSPPLGITIGTLAATGLPNEIIQDLYEPGTNIAQKIDDLSKMLGANDWLLTPLDRTDGFHWRFDAPARLGTDRTASVEFHYNTGLKNCVDGKYRPSANDVSNDYTAVGPPPDGTTGLDTFLTRAHAEAYSQSDINAVGIYEGWDSNDSAFTDVQTSKAGEQVTAYHSPPRFFEVTPAPETSDTPGEHAPPKLGIDYWIGDEVGAALVIGALRKTDSGRITQIDVTEDANGEPKVTNTIAPDVGAGVTLSYR